MKKMMMGGFPVIKVDGDLHGISGAVCASLLFHDPELTKNIISAKDIENAILGALPFGKPLPSLMGYHSTCINQENQIAVVASTYFEKKYKIMGWFEVMKSNEIIYMYFIGIKSSEPLFVRTNYIILDS